MISQQKKRRKKKKAVEMPKVVKVMVKPQLKEMAKRKKKEKLKLSSQPSILMEMLTFLPSEDLPSYQNCSLTLLKNTHTLVTYAKLRPSDGNSHQKEMMPTNGPLLVLVPLWLPPLRVHQVRLRKFGSPVL